MNNLKDVYCSVCGYHGKDFQMREIINHDLYIKWNLDKKLKKKFDLRESSNCPSCGNSARTRALASSILISKPLNNVVMLKQWVSEANKIGLHVAEINACGKLHDTLKDLRYLSYSEYMIAGNPLSNLSNWIKGIYHQDIQNLSYTNSSFDLVLHSEVLEHVSSPSLAIRQCKRVLKKDGICLFTVPLIMSRRSRTKAKNIGKKIIYLSSPSFHGSGEPDNLVYWEFGKDIIKKLKAHITFADPTKELYVLSVKK